MSKLLKNFWFVLIMLAACSDDDDNTTPAGDDEDFEFAVEIGDSTIPYIVINTRDEAIQNEPKIIADLDIYEEKQKVQSTTIGIEFRGSTSFRLSDKKSYGIETWDENGNDIDLSFFGFPEEEDWILIGNVVNESDGYIFDRTMLYHHIGYTISREMEVYASRTKFVELEINGEYLGVYVFMEKLKRDEERIDITNLTTNDVSGDEVTGGYIIKIDKTSGGDLNLNQPLEYFLTNWDDDARYNSDISWRSQYDIFGETITFPPFDAPYHANQYLETYFVYEDPTSDQITTEQKAYIQNYIDEFEAALLWDDFETDTRTYTNYIDVNSFVDYFLINEVCRNIDAYRLSTYLTKDRNGKLKMGPVWDMNIGFDNADNNRIPVDDWVINYNNYVSRDAWMTPFWWPRLLEDPQFRLAVKARWTILRSGVMSTSNLQSIVDETANNLITNGAIDRNYGRWDAVPVDYLESINSLKAYLENRTDWMDTEISSF
ncbi:MAG: CotH kinase family protein [Bacteroidota bacterium]